MNNKYNSRSDWDKLLSSKKYLSDFSLSAKIRSETALEIIKHLNVENIVNIGSGQGYLERMAGNLLDRIVWICVDISLSGLKNLGNLNVYRILGYAHSLPLKSKSMDCCVCMEVLEHVSKNDVCLVYKELRRVLRSGGYLIVSVPVYEPESLTDHPVGHQRKYVPAEIKKELISGGFKVVETFHIYAFRSMYWFKRKLCELLKVRRPSIIFLVCRKR